MTTKTENRITIELIPTGMDGFITIKVPPETEARDVLAMMFAIDEEIPGTDRSDYEFSIENAFEVSYGELQSVIDRDPGVSIGDAHERMYLVRDGDEEWIARSPTIMEALASVPRLHPDDRARLGELIGSTR